MNAPAHPARVDLATFHARYSSPRLAPQPWRAAAPSHAVRHGLVAVAVVAAVALACALPWRPAGAVASPPVAAPAPAAVPAAAPVPGPSAAPPVGRPDYPFRKRDGNGAPMTWPCGPIPYRVALEGAPAGARELVADAVQRISAVSGYEFREDPPLPRATGTNPGSGLIVVGWLPAQQLPGYSDGVIGSGGSSWQEGGSRYTGGFAYLLSDWDGSGRVGFGERDAGPVLLHELGHALGLGHVDDPNAVMNPTDHGVSAWSPGEVAALRYLRQSCAPAG